MSHSDPLRVAVIIGSTREDRFCPVPANWIADHARARGDMDVDVIDLLEENLSVIQNGDDEDAPLPESVRALQPRIARADAFIVVTPVYNRSFPASVKNAINWYYEEWSAKAVGFVSYGGMNGGIPAVEQLRQVFNEMNAATMRNTVSFVNFWEKFTETGTPIEADGADAAAKGMLEQLTWWAHALREARRASEATA